MVLNRNIQQVVKKKHSISSKDKKDWITFTKKMGEVEGKEIDHIRHNPRANHVQKLDLHGFSLNEANKMVKNFITKSFNSGYKKLLIVTGKGLRSKICDNPYLSEKLNVLKYSVPNFIKNEKDLNDKIKRVEKADLKDGGEGAIYIYLNL